MCKISPSYHVLALVSGQAGLFVPQDVGWLQLLVSVDLASRAEVLTACKPSQILS